MLEVARTAVTKANKEGIPPVKLSFNNLEYEVTVERTKDHKDYKNSKTFKQKIIKNISGYAMPG